MGQEVAPVGYEAMLPTLPRSTHPNPTPAGGLAAVSEAGGSWTKDQCQSQRACFHRTRSWHTREERVRAASLNSKVGMCVLLHLLHLLQVGQVGAML